jgi:hypothetical protein
MPCIAASGDAWRHPLRCGPGRAGFISSAQFHSAIVEA